MERVGKLCRDCRHAYRKDGAMASKATEARRKIRKALSEDTFPEKLQEAVELVWRSAYYDALSILRKDKRLDPRYLELAVSIFSGELQSLICAVPEMTANFNIYLGDMHRYISSPLAKEQSTMFYERAIEMNPSLGQPLNQLGITSEPVDNIRLFLHALLAETPFQHAWDNLIRSLTKDPFEDTREITVNMIICSLIHYNRVELNEHCNLWMVEVRDLPNPLSSELTLLIHIVGLNAILILARSSEEAFRTVLLIVCDAWILMLNRIRGGDSADTDSSDDEALVMQKHRRRRRASESDEVPEEEKENEESPRNDPLIPQYSLWVLATAADWLNRVYQKVEEMKRDKKTVPKAISEKLDSLLCLLAEKANRFVSSLEAVSEVDAEADWLIRGPNMNGDRTRATHAAAFWLFQCCASQSCPLSFVGYFKVQKDGTTRASEEIGRKMAKLRLEIGGKEDLSWVPVYVVADSSALVSRATALSKVLRSNELTMVVPEDVLKHLDKSKSHGPNFRRALRMIQLGQQKGNIRVQKVDGVVECAKSLCPKDSPEDGSTLVSILSVELDQYKDTPITGGAVSLHHVDTFCDRWNKEVSWRSL